MNPNGTGQPGELVRNGATIKYRLFPGSNAAEPLVFVHGWAGSSLDWQPLIDILNGQGETCLVYDTPGFGESKITGRSALTTADFSYERCNTDLLAVIEAAGFNKVRLVGHSWGGVVTMNFAAAHPDKVSNLVAIGAAYFDPQNKLHQIFKWVSWLIAWLIVLVKPLLRRSRRMRRIAVRRYTFRPLTEKDGEAIMSDVISSDDKALVPALLASYEVDFKKVCPAIKVPTLYIGGNKDVAAPIQFVKPFVDLTPCSKYAVLDGCGHFPMQEMTGQLLSACQNFWKSPA